MNVTLCYTHVVRPLTGAGLPEQSYRDAANRFMASYDRFRPKFPHHVMTVLCGQEQDLAEYPEGIFYTGGAKDCGAYLHAAQALKVSIYTDWVVMMNSHVYWTQPGAIDALLSACEQHGDGLYGPWGSFEVSPHIRTACMATRTENLLMYPHKLTEFHDANRFECGDISFTGWMRARGKPTLMVTRQGVYDLPDWRKPQNVFRKGDQSALLMRDRHTDIYDAAAPEERARLERAADGL